MTIFSHYHHPNRDSPIESLTFPKQNNKRIEMIKHFIVECIRQEKHFKTMTISIETGACEVTWNLFCNNDEDQVLGIYPMAKHILLYTFKKELRNSGTAIHIKKGTSVIFTISVIFCDLKNSVYGYKAEFNDMIDKLTTTRNYYD